MKLLILSIITVISIIILISCSDEHQDINLTQTQVNEIIVGSGGTYVTTPTPIRTVTPTPIVGSSYTTPTPYITTNPPVVL